MAIEEVISLGVLAFNTIQKMVAEGRAKTTADEMAALHAAITAADQTDAEWAALPGGPNAPTVGTLGGTKTTA